MKKLAIVSLAFISTSAMAYQCNRTVNANKVVLFVDVNLSSGEAESAARAACERGETFKSIPDRTTAKSFATRKADIDAKWEAYFKCDDKPNYNAAECEKKGKEVQALSNTYDYEVEKKGITEFSVTAELSSLAKKNIAVSSVVISGHDGGGSIHGAFGGIDKNQMIEALKTAYKGKPNLLNQLNSVFMWGCWTMGPSEVSVWRESLPSIKMLGGFFDMGPLATTAASQTVIHDLLVKEKKITESSEKNAVKNMINSVENINSTYAAVYAESNCGQSLYYYNTKGQPGTENKNLTPGNHFVDFDHTFDCKKMAGEIEKNRQAFMPYYNGTTPIPTNTSSSPLRNIYAFVRTNSQCLKPNSVLNGDRILMMVFSEGVKKNFATVFEDNIKKAETEFKKLDSFLAKYKPKGMPMKNFKDYFQKGKEKYFSPTAENLKNKDRKEIKAMISYLEGMVNQGIVKTDKAFAKNVEAIKKLKNNMENYLYQMNPECMDALEWHEFVPGHVPYAQC